MLEKLSMRKGANFISLMNLLIYFYHLLTLRINYIIHCLKITLGTQVLFSKHQNLTQFFFMQPYILTLLFRPYGILIIDMTTSTMYYLDSIVSVAHVHAIKAAICMFSCFTDIYGFWLCSKPNQKSVHIIKEAPSHHISELSKKSVVIAREMF